VNRVERWERRAEIPLLLLAAAFVVAYAWPVVDPNVDPGVRGSLNVLSWTVWTAFAIDLVIRLALADDRGRYALRHWYDVALVVLPVLRALRLLRLLVLLRMFDRSAASNLAGRVLAYAAAIAVMSVGLGALAVLDAEQDVSDANIATIGDALWWACTTVTTVGYGDYFPVTLEGRVVAVVLMVVGIGLVGTVTASVAAWLLARIEGGRAQEDS
jgi:voltage-gated potassium channel